MLRPSITEDGPLMLPPKGQAVAATTGMSTAGFGPSFGPSFGPGLGAGFGAGGGVGFGAGHQAGGLNGSSSETLGSALPAAGGLAGSLLGSTNGSHKMLSSSNDLRLTAAVRLDDENAEATMVAVREGGFHMRQALEKGDLKETLRHANALLWELRTSSLTHSQNYRLYCAVVNELSRLDAFMARSDFRYRGRFMHLYETVQHAGNAIPRLYLTITVAKFLIGSGEEPTKLVLSDLSRMLRIVQHPLRGLYARHYMLSTLVPVLKKSIRGSVKSQEHRHVPRSSANPTSAINSSAHNPGSTGEWQTPRDQLISTDRVTPRERAESWGPEELSGAKLVDTKGNECSASQPLPSTGSPARSNSEEVASEGRDCCRADAFEFLFSNLKACNKLLTRLEYMEGRGIAGREAKKQHAFIATGCMQSIADLAADDPVLYRSKMAPEILEFVTKLQNAESQTILLQDFIACFSPALSLLRLGDILAVLFRSQVSDMTPLLTSLSDKLRTSDVSSLALRPEIALELGEQIERLIHEAINSFEAFCGEVTSADVPQGVVVPPLVVHWLMLLKSSTIVMPIYVAAGGATERLIECVRLLLFNYRGSISDLTDSPLSEPHVAAISRGRSSASEETVTSVLAAFLEVTVRLTGLTEVTTVLSTEIFTYTPEELRPKLSEAILGALVKAPLPDVQDPQKLSGILGLATPYVKTTVASQHLARLPHRVVDLANTDASFALLALIRASCDCITDTASSAPAIASLVYEVCKVARAVGPTELKDAASVQFDCRKVLQFVHGCVVEVTSSHPQLALTLALMAASTSDWLDQLWLQESQTDGGYSLATYEFLSVALCVYEEHYVHSKDEFSGLLRLIAFMTDHIRAVGAANFEAISARLCNYSSRLLRRPEQCRSVMQCAMLFNSPCCRDPQRVSECLQKAAATAQLAAATTAQHATLTEEVETLRKWCALKKIQ